MMILNFPLVWNLTIKLWFAICENRSHEIHLFSTMQLLWSICLMLVSKLMITINSLNCVLLPSHLCVVLYFITFFASFQSWNDYSNKSTKIHVQLRNQFKKIMAIKRLQNHDSHCTMHLQIVILHWNIKAWNKEKMRTNWVAISTFKSSIETPLCTMHVAKLSITKFQIANGNLEPRSYKVNFIKSFTIMDNSKLDSSNSMWVTKLHGGERNAFSGSTIQWFKLLNECNLASKGCSRTNGLQWALEP